MATNIVTTTWKENMQFESDNPSGINLFMDAGEESGGKGEGYRPKALMLASLAGCSGLDIVSLLKKMRAEAADFKIEITAELTDEHPKFYNKVKVDYHFTGNNLKEDKIKKAVDLSVDKYCGVMEMFRQFAEVETEIFLHEL
ncbi:OsmC family protein [uncultured Polaribacter sp.]|uniref:OsmC family protein n=1 Tax=uncultured Polaribacter sp. TaxID=174711 RepID=UPI00262A28D4|nr:OsmC family protein [uncultured Polaribacter sp.]